MGRFALGVAVGDISAVESQRTCCRAAVCALLWVAPLAPGSCSRLSAATVTVDGAATNQVIDGFGVNINHRSWNNNDLKPVLDALVDQTGMTLFRVIYDKADWESTNDNSDPNVMKWSYYNQIYSSTDFQRMWDLTAYLNQKGISNGLFFNFQGNGPTWLGGGSLGPGMEAEWAEMVASLLVYARLTNHLQFSLVGPDNEMDQVVQGVDMTATQYTNALHKLSQLLDTNGLGDMRFIGPDFSTGGTTFMPQMMADPVVMSKLAHFGLHSYNSGGTDSSGVASYLQGSAYPNRDFWMDETGVWCQPCDSGVSGTNSWDYSIATIQNLCAHLANGAAAFLVWEGYDSQYNYYNPGQWSFWGLFAVDDTNAVAKTYTPRKLFYTLSQLTKWVPPGSQYIRVSGSTSPFSPLLAFKHSGLGQVTIVGINTSGSPATLSGTNASLPALVSFALYYTSATTNLAYGGTVAVTNGMFNATIPADCVFTLSGFAGVNIVLTNPPGGAQFNAPAAIPLAASAATSTGSIQKVEFYSGSSKLGESDAPPYQFAWTNVPMGDYSLSAVGTDTTGNTRTSAVVVVAVAGDLASISLAPASAVVPAGNSLQFTSVGADLLGHFLNPQPAFLWSVSLGGTIDGTGLFTAGNSVGGPVQVVASSGGITATALVSVAAVPGGIFGNTNYGSAADSMWNNGSYINAGRFLAASSLGVSTVCAKVAGIAGRYQCAIYADSGGAPSGFLKGTVQLTNSAAGWNVFPLTSSLTLTNGRYYWLAVWSDDTSAQIYYSDTSGTAGRARNTYGASWPGSIANLSSRSFSYCIFAQEAGKTNPPLIWSDPPDVVYGTPLDTAQLDASSSVPGTFTYAPPAATVLSAGSGQNLFVNFLPQDTNTYFGLISNVHLNVLPQAMTIAANNTNKVYGAPVPALTASYSGFVNGDTPASLDAPAVVTTTATAGSDVGDYPLTPAGAVDGNYVFQYQAGTLSVTPSSLAIAANSTNKVYGAPVPALTASYSGFVNGDTPASLEAPAVVATTATAGSDVGDYPLTPAGAADENYAFQYQAGTLSVTPAATSGALVSSANPAAQGAPVTFTYTLGAVPPGAGTPTGEVRFVLNATNRLPLAALSNGAAQVSTVLAAGSQTVEAEYEGSLNFLGTTNQLAPLQLIVGPPSLLITNLGDGTCLIRTKGLPWNTCRIEYTRTLADPRWQTFASGATDGTGVFECLILPSQGVSAAFFRSILVLYP
jgi:O-glycosyl hydrolase